MIHSKSITAHSIAFFLLLFFVTGCGSISEPEKAVNRLEPSGVSPNEAVELISGTLALFPDNTQFAIAFVDDTLRSYYGAQRFSDTLKTVSNQDRVFEIGSITKVFTSAILSSAETDGRLDKHESVHTHLDFQLNNEADFTFLHLSNHTSGLPRIPPMLRDMLLNFRNPYKNYNQERFRNYIENEMELLAEPGSQYEYSNTGTGLLGNVLSAIYGVTFEDLLQETLFNPFGMNRSTTNRSSVAAHLEQGLNKRGRTTPYWDITSLAASGAVLSSVEDLSTFLSVVLSGQYHFLNNTLEPTFTISDTMKIGMGWHISLGENGRLIHWHNGGTGGFSSFMAVDAKQNRGIVILANISAGHSHARNIDRLGVELLKME